MRRTILTALVALTLVVSGCATLGGGADAQSGDPKDLALQEDGDAGAERAGDGSGTGESRQGSAESGNAAVPSVSDESSQQERVVIRNGTVELEVSNFSTARGSIERSLTDRGGYVADATSHRNEVANRTYHTGRLVLRVPAENFSAVRESVEAEGTVEHSAVRTADVTDRLVDLEARLENLERERDRLRTFMAEANTTQDLVTIEERLSEVQGQIERLEADRRVLLDRVAYSTLTVELREPRPSPAEGEDDSLPALTAVFTDSVSDVVDAGQRLLVTVVALVPWAFAVGLPVGLAAIVVRRRSSGLFANGSIHSGSTDSAGLERGEDESDDDDGSE